MQCVACCAGAGAGAGANAMELLFLFGRSFVLNPVGPTLLPHDVADSNIDHTRHRITSHRNTTLHQHLH